jgi:hypothetical protein
MTSYTRKNSAKAKLAQLMEATRLGCHFLTVLPTKQLLTEVLANLYHLKKKELETLQLL